MAQAAAPLADLPVSALSRPDYALSDSLWADHGAVFITGTQALLRLMMPHQSEQAFQSWHSAGPGTASRRASSASAAGCCRCWVCWPGPEACAARCSTCSAAATNGGWSAR